MPAKVLKVGDVVPVEIILPEPAQEKQMRVKSVTERTDPQDGAIVRVIEYDPDSQ